MNSSKGSGSASRDIQVKIQVTSPHFKDDGPLKSDVEFESEMLSLFKSLVDSSSIRFDVNKLSDVGTISELPSSSLMDHDVNLSEGRHCWGMKPFLFGNQQKIDDYIQRNEYANGEYGMTIILKGLTSFARSIGQPLFLNNIISGLIILLGLTLENPGICPFIIVSFFISYATTKVICISPHRIDTGEFFGPLLYTTLYEFHILQSLPISLLNNKFHDLVAYFITSKIIMSVIHEGITRLFLKQNLPIIHTSFVVLQWISKIFLAKLLDTHFQNDQSILQRNIDAHVILKSGHFGEIMLEMIFSLSRLYFSSSRLLGGLILLVSIPIFSLSLTFDAIFGIFFTVLISYISPLLQTGGDFGQTVINGTLAFMSVNFFFSLSIVTKIMGLFACSLVLCIQILFVHSREKEGRIVDEIDYGMLPFCIGFYIIYLAFERNKYMVKVDFNLLKFPEMHKRLFRQVFAVGDE